MARLNFNREPYFDDTQEDKNFFQILFRPSRAIQTRELNALQSILGLQTETFADHIFKFGSMVRSGSIRYQNYTSYVRVKDLTPSGDAVDMAYFTGRRVQGKSSGLVATVKLTSGKDTVDPATLWVEYLNTAVDGETGFFVNGEVLEVLDDNGYVIYEATVRCPSCPENPDADTIEPTGFGSLFAIDSSAYYVHGKMVPAPAQTIYLDKYETLPSYKIGFDIVQTIVTADDDTSLLDNALGTPNFVAPGADRYKINLVLTKKPRDDEDDENFVLLADVDGGYLQRVADKPQYSEIMDTMARRTYDESGDYTVRPFRLNFREHLDTGTNDGWLTEEDGGDESKFIAVVSTGKAYVRGRELERIAESVIPIDKARESEYKRSSVVRTYMGNYITITMDPVGNTLPLSNVTATNDFASDFERVNLYDGPSSGGNYSGNQIGTARVKNIELLSGTAGTDAVYALYVFEIVLGAGKTIQDVEGLHRTGGGNQTFSANIEPDPSDGTTKKIYDPNNNKMLWKLPYNYTKSIRDADNPLVSNTTVNVIKKLVGAINSANKVIFTAEGDETFLDFDSTRWIGGLQDSGPGGNFVEYDLSVTDRIVVTPSEITVQNFDPSHVGKNFALTCEVLKANAKEKTKVLDTHFLNDIDATQTTISLGKADVYQVVSIINVTDPDPENHVDVTANYQLVTGVKDNYYDISSLVLRTGVTVPDPGDLLDIQFSYFQHVGNGYYFSPDSYTTIINDPTIDFDYDDVPSYIAKDGTEFRMSDTLDFRPTVATDGTFTSSGAVLSNVPIDNSNVIFDIEYYMPRVDLLCLREDGEFVLVHGNPDLEPQVPNAAANSMPIYHISIAAYTFGLSTDVRMLYLDNKRYTMRDIGKLEKRIQNLEYYVTFNLLEKATADEKILDSNGNDRFKNGFLVDNFKDFVASATDSPEYNCALDTSAGELRPSFISKAVHMSLNEGDSSHFKRNSKVVTLPYDEVSWLVQPFATKTISVNPYFVFNKAGRISLSPATDMWKDVTQAPNIVNSIDTGFEALESVANAAGVLGTTWGNWATTNTLRNSVNQAIGGGGTRTTTTTIRDQTREGIDRRLEREVTEHNLGTFVTEVNLIPYCRSVPVQFAAADMRANTRVYAFFDGVDVNDDCRPLNGANGDEMVTDANGAITGVFTIPNRPDKRFFVGTREFRLTNSPTDSTDADELLTSGVAKFHAGGLEETRQSTILSVETPTFIEDELVENRTTTEVRSVDRFPAPPAPPAAPRRTSPRIRMDPLAQSFLINEVDGLFLTGCDIYFAEKDDRIPVWFEIRNMVNGYPGPTVLPFSHCSLKPENVNTSDDASVATRFQFAAPVYLMTDTEYCMVIGSSIETYRVYVARLGGETIGNNSATVSTQPLMGSMFKSQNNTTWTAEQYEDVMFNLLRADFDTSARMALVFNNNDFGLKTALPVNPLETETGERDVRVHMENHGFAANDKVKIELLQETWYEIDLISGNLVVGQQLIGGTNAGTAIISELVHVGDTGTGNDIYNVRLAELKGKFDDGEQFTAPVLYEEFDDTNLLAALDIEPKQLVHNVGVGSFPTGVDNTFNGVPLADISTPEHLVQHVDSMDSFIIQVDTPATDTGRVGGDGAFTVGNIQTDVFDFQLNFMDFEGDSTWDVSGVAHAAVGSNVTNYASVGPLVFIPNETRKLITPMKIATEINQDMQMAGQPSITINGGLGSINPFVSPVINMEAMIFTTITNRVEWNDCPNFSVAPNADTGGNPVICDSTDVSYTGTHRWKVETDYDGGSEGAKYIMKPVNLDNPATNIKIYMDILTFLDTEVTVFYRTLPAESDDEIKNVEWIELAFDAEVLSEKDDDFRETEITVPNDPIDILPEFKAFQVKIILRSKNTARPPKVKNFRAIAVT